MVWTGTTHITIFDGDGAFVSMQTLIAKEVSRRFANNNKKVLGYTCSDKMITMTEDEEGDNKVVLFKIGFVC